MQTFHSSCRSHISLSDLLLFYFLTNYFMLTTIFTCPSIYLHVIMLWMSTQSPLCCQVNLFPSNLYFTKRYTSPLKLMPTHKSKWREKTNIPTIIYSHCLSVQNIFWIYAVAWIESTRKVINITITFHKPEDWRFQKTYIEWCIPLPFLEIWKSLQ